MWTLLALLSVGELGEILLASVFRDCSIFIGLLLATASRCPLSWLSFTTDRVADKIWRPQPSNFVYYTREKTPRTILFIEQLNATQHSLDDVDSKKFLPFSFRWTGWARLLKSVRIPHVIFIFPKTLDKSLFIRRVKSISRVFYFPDFLFLINHLICFKIYWKKRVITYQSWLLGSAALDISRKWYFSEKNLQNKMINY